MRPSQQSRIVRNAPESRAGYRSTDRTAPPRMRSPHEALELALIPLPAEFHPDARRASNNQDINEAPPVSPFGHGHVRPVADLSVPTERASSGRRELGVVPTTEPLEPTPHRSPRAVASVITNAPMRAYRSERAELRPAPGTVMSISTTPGRRTVSPTAKAAAITGVPTAPSRPGVIGQAQLFVTTGATALSPAVARETDAYPDPLARPLRQRPASPKTEKTPNLRVVPKTSVQTSKKPKIKREAKPLSTAWKRRLRVLGITSMFGVIVAVAFGAIGMHAHLASRQLELDAVRSKVVVAEREHQTLRLQVARLDTPEQVVSAAYSLGLASANQVEFLPTATTIAPTVAGPAAPKRP